MKTAGHPPRPAPPRSFAPARAWWWGCLLLLASPLLRAEIQFDVFMGFDDRVREAHWFPVSFEILNDGPAFTGTVTLAPDGAFDGQHRDFRIELPTGTRKQVSIPVFSSNGRSLRWDAQLLDGTGKMVAERTGLQPRDVAAHIPVLGALPRSFAGIPVLPELKNRAPDYTPAVSRLQSDYLPVNPIAYESLTALYLNSEKAADLKPAQIDALLGWLHEGGHLIIAIESPTDINAVLWLRGLLPFLPDSVETRPIEGSFERWLVSGKRILQLPSAVRRNAPIGTRRSANRQGRVVVQTPANASEQDPFTQIEPQNDFNNAEMPVVRGRIHDGETILALGNLPLIQSAPRGRGTITVLAFSPEREPFRSWKNRAWFWAKILGGAPELFTDEASIRGGGPSIDGLFGAMLDSRQVRKLPVAALLLILVVYLAVIGPFDQWILKRTGRQMWTWVTFPIYVAVFSGLIYFIGYRLRAGALEWNEIQVVDQLPRENGAALRGRTWSSLYSPANARYRLASEQAFATIRSELQPPGSARTDSARMSTHYPAKGVDAEVYVPVWVSQLFTSDWLEPAAPILQVQASQHPDGLHLSVTNVSTMRFEELKVAHAGRLHDLGGLEPGTGFERTFPNTAGTALDDLISSLIMAMDATQQRRNAFGSETSGQFARNLQGIVLASLSQRYTELIQNQRNENFTVPASFDVDSLLRRGEAVLFAWAPGQSIAPNLARFSTVRSQRDTALRVALPVPAAK